MFCKVIILSVLVGVLVAFPQAPNNNQPTNNQPRFNPPRNNQARQDNAYNAKILRSQNDNKGTGNFNWGFESDLPQTFESQGSLQPIAPNGPKALSVKGSWSYIDHDNKHVLVNYTSGVDGYRETRTYS